MDKAFISQSLFQTLIDEFNWQKHTVTVSLETVKHLSFSLENVVIQEDTKTLMFVGFQTVEAFQKVTHRYQQLDKHVDQIYVFAQGDIDASRFSNITFCDIDSDDPINHEWFILAISSDFAVVMSAKELHNAGKTDDVRMFNLLWSFLPTMAQRTLEILLEKVQFYNQQKYEELSQQFVNHNMPTTNLELANELTLQMIQYKQDVQNRLRFTHNSLLETYEYSQLIIDLSPALICAMNPAQKLTLVNQKMVDLLDIEINELLGHSISDYCATKQDYQKFVTHITEVLANRRRIVTWESDIVSHSGTVHTIEWYMRPIQHNNHLTILAIGQDITELRVTQQGLIESQKQLEDIMESVKTYIYMLQYDAEQNILSKAYSSPVLTELTGYQVEQVEEDSYFWINTIIHPEDRDYSSAALEKLQHGHNAETQYRIVCKDGTIKWVMDSARAYTDEINGIVSIYGTVEDITERVQMQDELLKQEKLRLSLEHENQALKMRNEFVTTVSHEFRTPLATILSATEMLENYSDRMTPENKKNRFQIITEQVDQLRRMLDDINIIIESQTDILFAPQPHNLACFMQTSIEEVKKLTQTQLEFVVDIAPMPDVIFDDRLMSNVMKNLLINAVSYSTGDRPITFSAEIEDDMLIMRITNFGIGIDPEDGERIFESFYRGRNHPQHKGGTGLGLRIVKDFVERHGGTVDFTSSAQDGTCFRIRIPYRYQE